MTTLRKSKRIADAAIKLKSHPEEDLSALYKQSEKPSKRIKVKHIEIKVEATELEDYVEPKPIAGDQFVIPSKKIIVKTEPKGLSSKSEIIIKQELQPDQSIYALDQYRLNFKEDEFEKKYSNYFSTGIPCPKNWLEIYKRVKIMRRSMTTAPVDTMGCERLPDTESTPVVRRFQLLIALMLSSQTKDQVVYQAIQNLRAGLPGSDLTLQAVRESSEKEIDQMIRSVGFHTRKSQYMKKTAEILHEKFNDDIPETIEGMVSLPGVGPKMAHLLMHRAWGQVQGIGVDVHVHRLSALWGWAGRKTTAKDPEDTRKELQDWLPQDLWMDINPTLVGFGQVVCGSRKQNCGDCLVGELCPGYRRRK